MSALVAFKNTAQITAIKVGVVAPGLWPARVVVVAGQGKQQAMAVVISREQVIVPPTLGTQIFNCPEPPQT